MNHKILITGQPKCGKSTLISKLIDYYTNKKKLAIYGFLTPEIKERGKRIGFDIIDINSGNRNRLARVGDCNTKYHVGKYCVFVEEFDKYIEENLNIEGKEIYLIVIDEIGKMELFSKNFHKFVKRMFSSEYPILATIGLNLSHPIKSYIQHLPSILILNLNHQNFQIIYEKILSLLA